MGDLLLRSQQASGLHGSESIALSREAKFEKPSSQSGNIHALRKAVSKTLRDANNTLHSWKDGLTVEERMTLRLREERKEVLSLNMKTVRFAHL